MAFSEKEEDSLLKAHNNAQNGFAASRAIAASLISLGSPVAPANGSVTPTSTLPHGLGSTGGHSSDSFPMHKVYEMRGTMLHEMQGIGLFQLLYIIYTAFIPHGTDICIVNPVCVNG